MAVFVHSLPAATATGKSLSITNAKVEGKNSVDFELISSRNGCRREATMPFDWA